MTFAYIPVASKMHDRRELSTALEGQERALVSLGGRRIDGDVADRDPVAFYFVQTGGVENEVIRRYRSRVQQGRGGDAERGQTGSARKEVSSGVAHLFPRVG